MDTNLFWPRGPDCRPCNCYTVRIDIFSQNFGAQPKIKGLRATGYLLMSIPGTVGHRFDRGPRHTKVVENDT